jgi:hypothetical protein
MRRVVLAFLVLATARIATAASSAEIAALEIDLRVEREILKSAQQVRATQLGAEQAAAGRLQAAAAAVVLASATPADPALEAAERELRDAEMALPGLVANSVSVAGRVADQQLRVAGLEAALAILRDQPRGDLTGTWDLRIDPGAEKGTLQLEQHGTLLSGDYRMTNGGTGSITGTFAASILRWERVDATAGRDAVFTGSLVAGALEGDWLATVYGRGTSEVGRWHATRVETPPAAPDAEPAQR